MRAVWFFVIAALSLAFPSESSAQFGRIKDAITGAGEPYQVEAKADAVVAKADFTAAAVLVLQGEGYDVELANEVLGTVTSGWKDAGGFTGLVNVGRRNGGMKKRVMMSLDTDGRTVKLLFSKQNGNAVARVSGGDKKDADAMARKVIERLAESVKDGGGRR